MSTRLKHAKTSIRGNNIKWLNSIVHSHDFICDCPTPLQHAVILILQQEPEIDFTTPEKDLIRKCLGDTTTAATATDPGPDAFGDEEGILEELFKEDIGEEDNTG